MFGLFKGNKNENENRNENNIIGAVQGSKTELQFTNQPLQLNLSKEQSLLQLDLRKETFSKICANLPDLQNMKAKVALVLDFSGSMNSMFTDGTVQALIERLMPIACQFDDNGELDLWIFENGFKRLAPVNMNNFYGLAKHLKDNYRMGGTCYAPVMRDIINKYTVEEPSDVPTYVIFVTDGDNSDKSTTTKLIVDSCTKPIFWQCVGIGNGSMNYLEKLDDLPNRQIDNVDFFKVTKPNNVTDESLYAKLFDEYPSWIRTVRSKRLIK